MFWLTLMSWTELTQFWHITWQSDVPTGDTSGSYVTGTAVTTRTATIKEDLSTNAKTQQLEEKTVATTTKQIADRQEQKVITQEVKTTVTSGEPQQVSSYCFLGRFMLTLCDYHASDILMGMALQAWFTWPIVSKLCFLFALF